METALRKHGGERTDDNPCGVPEKLHAAFGLLQEKWVLSIVYVLLRGPVGFNEVGRGAGSVNASTLAQRLARLEKAGLVKKTVQSTMPPRTSYELTAAGRDLRPVIDALVKWSGKHGAACPKHAAELREQTD
jgi:DNA-binding HxlR family transcriptional regulator